MGDRYNIHSQLEHLQSKYIGTGHADTTKWEWQTNQHRDSYASYVGHFDMLNYFSIAENESKARVKFNFLKKMVWITSCSFNLVGKFRSIFRAILTDFTVWPTAIQTR
jgi:splicing factor 3B subunit 5